MAKKNQILTVKTAKENNDTNNEPKIYLRELQMASAFITLNKKIMGKQETTSGSKRSPYQTNNKRQVSEQYTHFRDSMWLLLMTGLSIGIISVTGINGNNPADIRFSVITIRFLAVLIILFAQAIMCCLCIYLLLQEFSLFMLSYVAFYLFAGLISLSLIRVATKWPTLVTEISRSGLFKFTDPKCKIKCNSFVIVFMILAAVEHLLSILERLIPIIKCNPSIGIYYLYMKITYNWLFSIGYPRNFVACVLNLISTLVQSYSDVFVICASVYLSAIYSRINSKILKTTSQKQSSVSWRSLRVDYNQATRLVRCFDDSINTLVFISFASNLFFICFQLFKVLGRGMYTKFSTNGVTDINCTETPILNYAMSSDITEWNVQTLYHVMSVLFLLGRFLLVTLFTAKINNEAEAPTVALYSVSSDAYNVEIERFLEQINNDTVALSGLRFFNVTRGLLLSVVATIITYELVLMQYSSDFIQ